jgi:predicted MPP superfamily phosphohydrolase
MNKLGVLFIALGSAACAVNQSGNTSASSSGDTSHPAERRSPLEDLQAACGPGLLTDLGTAALHRQPYLQQVETNRALIGWTGDTGMGARVQVTNPDGSLLSTLLPEAEPQVLLRSSNQDQMWSVADKLLPSTVYCYQVENDSQALTERAGFKTAPSADSTEPVRFLAFGDSGGGGSDQYQLQEQMLTVPYDLILHTGDIAYEEGTLAQYQANVFDVYAELFRSIPFYPASGNHDYKTLSAEPFRDVFNLPGDSGEKWYSYNWGPAHFAALDTEADYKTQAAWLDHDLEANPSPWKIVYMHRPPYSSGSHGSDTGLRNALAPILKKHNVQLVLAGHDHDYERMVPQNGTTYVVTGGGGRGTYDVSKSGFTAFSEAVIHFVYGEINGDELTLHAIDASGKEFDSVVIPRT